MKRNLFFLSIVGASILAAGVTAYGVSKLSAPKPAPSVMGFASSSVGNHFTSYQKDNYPDLTYAAENAVKAVVNIEKIEEVKTSSVFGSGGFDFFDFFGIPQGHGYQQESVPQERRSGGSGVIISPDGYIVTNNHVIENASKLKVKLNDNRTFDAKIIGADPTTDVALIKIEGEDLPTLAFGNSDNLRLGEWVLAIGSPFDLSSTVTAGIVSAKARDLAVIPSQFRIESFIQTDAAVNPGNSGGALVNTKGELVGINTVIKSPTGSYAGYSFAVPSSIVRKVVVDLKEYGVVQRAMLGITFQEINDGYIYNQDNSQEEVAEKNGLYVVGVDPEGGAAAAGIKEGDIITKINDIQVQASSALTEEVARHRPNDKVTITVKRDGKVKQFEVILRNKAGKTELLKKDYVDVIESLGGQFGEINDKAKKEFKIDGGVQVLKVNEGGILQKLGVRSGFIITQINNRPITSINDISRISSKISSIEGVYPNGHWIRYSPTL